jgi:hypothetical protein
MMNVYGHDARPDEHSPDRGDVMSLQHTGSTTVSRIVIALALAGAVAASAFGFVTEPPESAGAMAWFR